MPVRVHLNCAVSRDGRMAGPEGKPVLLSGPDDLRRVHRLRAECDAILVGVGTVLTDDPNLRVKREWAEGPDPVRVILDSDARTPRDARVRDGSVKTLLLHDDGVEAGPGVEGVLLPEGPRELWSVLDALREHGIGSVLVEGGVSVMASFLMTDLWQRLTIYEAPITLGDGPEFRWPGVPDFRLRMQAEPLGEGQLWSCPGQGGAIGWTTA